MFQGTGSDVGKSLVVAGLCRALVRRGLAVRPFKPQNMSNNAAVALDLEGTMRGEIGRAQALQARACGVVPTVDMNPVLLKPTTDVGSQVVVQGRVRGNASARDYHRLKPTLLPKVLESFHRLRQDADVVLVEGAGSAAEVNLRPADIANMGFAEAAGVPVVLVGDIDRGGVIAQLVGTHALLTESERSLVAGYLINKFRGDPSLFEPALGMIGERTGMRSFGLIPWFSDARRLPAEDGMALEARARAPKAAEGQRLKVGVPRLSRIANFDDLDPLAAEPDVAVEFVQPGQPLPGDLDIVLLPGSKATRADLEFLRAQGWDVDILAHVRRGGRVIGLCAGYQMLGRVVRDPRGVEGPPGDTPGLGLLDVETEMDEVKTLAPVDAVDDISGAGVRGYEMHMGRTTGPGLSKPWLKLAGRPEGAVSSDGRVMGCYIHGLFASDAFRAVVTGRAAAAGFEEGVEAALDGLADHLERSVDVDGLLAAAGSSRIG